MSLSRLAVRLITVRALTGATLAEDRVFDSAIQSIDQMAKDRREPFIVVLTDDHTTDVTGRDMRHGSDSLDLVIEVAVAQRVEVQVQSGGVAQQVIIPHTDAGMEIVIDVICQQIMDALMGGTATWAALWRTFVLKVNRIASRRGAAAEDGTRFAARQLIITCDPLAAPVRGGSIPTPYADFMTVMTSDPEQSGLVPLIRYAMTGDATLPSEDLIASTLGIDPQTVDFIGMTPIRDSAGNAVQIGEVDIDVADQSDTPWELTETTADEQGA